MIVMNKTTASKLYNNFKSLQKISDTASKYIII